MAVAGGETHINCTKFGQLILGKIIKIVATRCHILRLKCTKFDVGWGSAPDPAGGAYSAPPEPLAGLRGPTSKGREGRGGKGRGREAGKEEGRERGKGKGRGREREREGGSLYNWKPPPPGRNPGYAIACCRRVNETRASSTPRM